MLRRWKRGQHIQEGLESRKEQKQKQNGLIFRDEPVTSRQSSCSAPTATSGEQQGKREEIRLEAHTNLDARTNNKQDLKKRKDAIAPWREKLLIPVLCFQLRAVRAKFARPRRSLEMNPSPPAKNSAQAELHSKKHAAFSRTHRCSALDRLVRMEALAFHLPDSCPHVKPQCASSYLLMY